MNVITTTAEPHEPNGAVGVTTTAVPRAAASEATSSAPALDSAVKQTSGSRPRRTTLSLHEKSITKAFCEERIADCKARNETAPSQETLRLEIQAKFGWEVGRSTLSKIMSLEWQQLDVTAHPNPNMKRKRRPLFPAFEEDLVKSVRAHIARQDAVLAAASVEVSALQAETDAVTAATTAADTGAPTDNAVLDDVIAREAHLLTEAVILEEAQRLKRQHGIKDEELVLSVGWLDRFKQRNGIRLRKASPVARQHADSSSSGSMTANNTSSGSSANPPKRRRPRASDAGNRSTLLWGPWPATPGEASPRFASSLSFECTLSRPSTLCASSMDAGPRPWPARVAMLRAKLPDAVQSLCCPVCPPTPPVGIDGLRVVLIGLNCVRDAFIAAALVGDHGSVACFEANEACVSTAMACVATEFTTKTLGYSACNLQVAALATLPTAIKAIKPADLVLINCAFQATTTKTPLLRAAFNLLKEGGECRTSYGATSRRYLFRSSEHAAPAPGAVMYDQDFRRMCQHVGFLDPRHMRGERRVLLYPRHDHQTPQQPQEPDGDGSNANAAVAAAKMIDVAVRTCRLFKIQSLEDRAENYGEHALYLGGLGDDDGANDDVTSHGDDGSQSDTYALDASMRFHANVRKPVDGNTAQMLRRSWLHRFFFVDGDRVTHLGPFRTSAEDL
ncbi:hypothetical protein PINS_up010415 [Pythium insidiosum]|nr:hypothetical protein PINS_up010415 [Pythium insidiosum]